MNPPGQPRRVLIVAYYFPPDAAVGALRPSRFARSLPRFGWEPIVLTVKERARDQALDVQRLEGLERVPIVRTREFPGPGALYRAMKSRMRASPTQASATAPAERSTPVTLASRIKRYVISLLVLLPDEQKSWSVPTALTAIRLIRKHRIDCVLTSAPPASAHFVGLVAKACTNARWIADFRDPWLESLEARSPIARSRVSDAIERRMERTVMKHADLVVTTTVRMSHALRSRYPTFTRRKLVCVPNGLDAAKFQPLGTVQKYAAFTITYAGTLYEGRTPEPLFEAVSRLIAQGRISHADVRIKLLGHCRDIDGLDTRAVAQRHGLESVVEVLDVQPHAEAIRIMQKSHLLLVISPAHHRLIVPAKLYDYLGSGSRILAIAEKGATTDLIRETNSGTCFAPSDIDGLCEYLCEAMQTQPAAPLASAGESLRRFDAPVATARLATAMSSLFDAALRASA